MKELQDIATLTTVAEQVAYWAPDLDFRKFAEAPKVILRKIFWLYKLKTHKGIFKSVYLKEININSI